MTEQMVKVKNAKICTERFGNPADPAILLIMGAQASLVWWEEEFCQRLADAGWFVIRYDNRDVGRSTTFELGNPGYTFEDMADDAICILDAYKIERAHIVGMSMGGIITQMIALRNPERVQAISLLATSNFAPDLPPMEDKVMQFFSNAQEVDWANEQAVIAFCIARCEVLVGSKYPLDEKRTRELAAAEFKRSRKMANINNHALITGCEAYLARTEEIAVPTLVIHGTEDPIIPYPHGVALAQAIPGAVLLTLEGTGHELPYGDWNAVLGGILQHSRKG
ncbi:MULTISPECIES: alpha/beta hydrolase [Brevibacillus]|jgi:Predicted hydrolases or acyltransferases (alpha/beta hydrolase superfamily)|uniref:alpha/beta fold hydrolase n=1 Tax=Brevibacillus TaxID=55080 RepID=UPI00247636DE|nr:MULTISPECIES: alpha/beta hydrolase [Brevibacillus]MDH6348366.1 pimeloyl-ACP methyl ester carboxylesterase [Brevibacillus sp. 1238]